MAESQKRQKKDLRFKQPILCPTSSMCMIFALGLEEKITYKA